MRSDELSARLSFSTEEVDSTQSDQRKVYYLPLFNASTRLVVIGNFPELIGRDYYHTNTLLARAPENLKTLIACARIALTVINNSHAHAHEMRPTNYDR
eukprot:IDg2057t1